MDDIKLAEEALKYLKDFVEVEKARKKSTTEKAKVQLNGLANELIEKAFENVTEINVKRIKGE